MRVAFVAAECEPWAKTGGLGDVVDALARALGRIPDRPDAPVDVFLPRYRSVPVPADTPVTRRLRVPDPLSPSGLTEVGLIEFETHGYRLRLVDHPPAFEREGYYGDGTGDYPDNAWRFGLFCRAALEALAAEGRPVDVLHLHDWHTAAAAILRQTVYRDDPTIGRAAILLTIHNLAFHGWTPAEDLRQLGLAPGDGFVALDADGLDLLRSGIELAELVNAVSPTFAAEARTRAFGMGLGRVLRAKGERFVGILNGIDPALWDPATDPVIAARYSRDGLAGKAACRADLLERLGFDAADPAPVLGLIGRLDPQKGFDILAAAAPGLLERGARLVVQGSGDPAHAAPFRALAAAEPERVALVERFDREMARRIYAGADLFLMPSRFEPCGQGQMIAQRYGTPPIVHRTGGLADTVIDEHNHPGAGTGFAFEHPTSAGLLWACDQAFAMRGRRGSSRPWRALVGRGMAVDFGWETGSAPRYVEAYRRAIDLRRDILAAEAARAPA